MRDVTPEQRISELGLTLPASATAAAHYELWTAHGDTLYLSGQLPRVGGQVAVTGRVGDQVTLEQGRHAARLCAIRALSVLRQALGSLDLVTRVLKLQVFVQCTSEFDRHSDVADAASDLLIQVFGASGRSARTAVGVLQLPKNASVELDVMVVAANR